MKSCPKCNRTFEDTFTFCLADGSLLSAPFDPQATQKLPNNIKPTVPASDSQYTPTLPQVSPPNYAVEPKTAGARRPGQNNKRRLLFVSSVLVIVAIGGILIIAGYYNRNSDSGNSTTASTRDSRQTNSNTNETTSLKLTPAAPSPTTSPATQPSPTPPLLTAVRVKLRMFTEGSGGDFPNEEEVTLSVGAQTFKKMSNSSGYVIFDNVPCGNEITITHEGAKGPNQVIVKTTLSCDKPLVDFGMFNQYGKFTNKSYIRS